jgi:hypothetical protein
LPLGFTDFGKDGAVLAAMNLRGRSSSPAWKTDIGKGGFAPNCPGDFEVNRFYQPIAFSGQEPYTFT